MLGGSEKGTVWHAESTRLFYIGIAISGWGPETLMVDVIRKIRDH